MKLCTCETTIFSLIRHMLIISRTLATQVCISDCSHFFAALKIFHNKTTIFWWVLLFSSISGKSQASNLKCGWFAILYSCNGIIYGKDTVKGTIFCFPFGTIGPLVEISSSSSWCSSTIIKDDYWQKTTKNWNNNERIILEED